MADPGALRLSTLVNGRTVQDGSTADMIFGVGELIAFVTRWITLQPGDVLLTGSPAGLGPLVPGDQVEARIEGVGTLSNPVVGPRKPCHSGPRSTTHRA
ncbi:fumarylacetoacetate hydrolase family protein [Streptomyces sp. NPDC057611]|uniref:fumarylacetoacetate hydrolase family protein n=1 Tax=Streptomyces sp. NPDC057611 TaxID=3346182 RepID=UPI0036BE8646